MNQTDPGDDGRKTAARTGRPGGASGRRVWRRWLIAVFAAVFAVPLIGGFASVFGHGDDWRTASMASTGIAPDPATNPEAIVQVYSARAFGWRAAFGVHTWIAVKPTDAPRFTVLEVFGWQVMRGLPAVRRSQRDPDGRWYGNAPEILFDLRGAGVDDVIARIEQAAESYPYGDRYTVWPGPNSNTFTAWVARQVPELRLDLPPTAIGKDFPTNGSVLDATPSGTGWQLSLFGLLGVMVALDEGFEINLLGLVFGIDVTRPALKLPGFGRLDLLPRDDA